MIELNCIPGAAEESRPNDWESTAQASKMDFL